MSNLQRLTQQLHILERKLDENETAKRKILTELKKVKADIKKLKPNP